LQNIQKNSINEKLIQQNKKCLKKNIGKPCRKNTNSKTNFQFLSFIVVELSLKTYHISLYDMKLRESVLHYPRLDTVLMIEKEIKKADYPKRTELWKKLPKKIMYQTFKVVIDYLIDSRKVILTKDDKLVWVFADSSTAKKLLRKSVLAHA